MSEQINDDLLAGQLPEYEGDSVNETTTAETTETVEEPQYVNEASKYLGTKLQHKIGGNQTDKEADKELVNEQHLTKVGEKIQRSADYREGWIDVDRALLGARSAFYPESWSFRIKPATVEAIRNWSTIDEENVNSIDNVFNEIIKCCLSIQTPTGPLPWGNINSWDRFFFILLIREYTFINGERKIEYYEECSECEKDVKFVLESQALMYEMPDEALMNMYDQAERSWLIDPEKYGLSYDPIMLYVPTVEKEANIKAWMIRRMQQDKKVDPVFIRFLGWLAPKISKDETISQRQIREYENIFKAWNTDMFSFMDEVIRNIIVTPMQKLSQICPNCGEEVTSTIRFQDGIRSLFSLSSGHRKFGSK